jgi:SAM-dependent methyltransferase
VTVIPHPGETTPGPGTSPDPGSFRDPTNRVFYSGDRVLRGLRDGAIDDWRALSERAFFRRMHDNGTVCRTWELDPTAVPDAVAEDWPVVLEHERIPFVSYPYEWGFSMLRDAALLHLDVVLAALRDGTTTKDGSAYNVQWRGTDPAFIDVGSFERLRPGEPWAGYRQFCQTLLYPLLLQAHLGVGFQPWLRSQVDGIESGQLRPLFGGTRRFRAGVLKHVHLHDAIQARFAGRSTRAVREDLRSAGFSSELVVATVRALRRLVGKLTWQPPASHWTAYQETCTYTDGDRAAKIAFVGEALAGAGDLDLALDLGANDGTYSRLAAEHARYVVAVEYDEATSDAFYQRLRAEGERRILPLVMDLANPSPGLGWRGRERAAFADRAGADAVLALAVIHHLAIGRNVPLAEIVDLLAGLGRRVVVEFVDPADPMAARLLANKPAGLFPEYRREVFERLLADRLTIERRLELPSGTRALYLAVPRG